MGPDITSCRYCLSECVAQNLVSLAMGPHHLIGDSSGPENSLLRFDQLEIFFSDTKQPFSSGRSAAIYRCLFSVASATKSFSSDHRRNFLFRNFATYTPKKKITLIMMTLNCFPRRKASKAFSMKKRPFIIIFSLGKK